MALRAPGLAGGTLINALETASDIRALVSDPACCGAGLSAESRTALKHPDLARIESDEAWLDQPDRHLVTWDQSRYPSLLRRIPSPPAALFVHGDPELLWRPQLAVIGSRNPTAAGLEFARDFATELVRCGLAVTSGLAAGIDSAAHEAALDAGGSTVAVCGTGPDQVYPASSRKLAQRIPGAGALVTEFPTGFPPRRQHFPSRNRIISGLALGVLVIEAGLNSGTLITARQAAEQGREVFALPGSLHNPLSRGCHRLIREGARLVESVHDIIEELGPLAGQLAADLRAELETGVGDKIGDDKTADTPLLNDPDYARLWDALGHDARSVEELVGLTGLQAREVSSMMLMLELRGRVRAEAGGRYVRCGDA